MKIALTALLAYAALIFTVSSLPNSTVEHSSGWFNIPQAAKHVAEFALFGFLMSNVMWSVNGEQLQKTFASGFALSVLYGVSDELHQGFVPTRYCTGFDMIMDAVGGLIGVAVFLGYKKLTRKEN